MIHFLFIANNDVTMRLLCASKSTLLKFPLEDLGAEVDELTFLKCTQQ